MSKYPEHPSSKERADTGRQVKEELDRIQARLTAERAAKSTCGKDDSSPGYPVGGHRNGRP
jgi:hypothetical protein